MISLIDQLTETMTCSINTVLTVIVVVVAILFFGVHHIQLYFSIIYRIDFWCILFNLHCRSAMGNNEKRQLKNCSKNKLVVYKEKKSNDEKILV